jgi:hypothetical protein
MSLQLFDLMLEGVALILMNGCQLLDLFVSGPFHIVNLVFNQFIILSLLGLPSD